MVLLGHLLIDKSRESVCEKETKRDREIVRMDIPEKLRASATRFFTVRLAVAATVDRMADQDFRAGDLS